MTPFVQIPRTCPISCNRQIISLVCSDEHEQAMGRFRPIIPITTIARFRHCSTSHVRIDLVARFRRLILITCFARAQLQIAWPQKGLPLVAPDLSAVSLGPFHGASEPVASPIDPPDLITLVHDLLSVHGERFQHPRKLFSDYLVNPIHPAHPPRSTRSRALPNLARSTPAVRLGRP